MIRQRLLPLMTGFAAVATLILVVATKPKPESREPSHASEAKQESTPTDLSPVQKFVQMESLKQGQPDSDPDSSYRRLKRVATQLRKQDIEALKNTAIDSSHTTDLRFLSVYLLALNGSLRVQPALLGIALEPLTIQEMSSKSYAEELKIRTQALEGLASTAGSRRKDGPLAEFLDRQDNQFLATQAQRLLNSRQ